MLDKDTQEKIAEFESIQKTAEALGIKKEDRIREVLRGRTYGSEKPRRYYKNWIFVRKSEYVPHIKLNTERVYKNPVIVIDTFTDEKIEYLNLSEASKDLNINYGTVFSAYSIGNLTQGRYYVKKAV